MIGIKGIAKKPIIDATANPEDVVSGKVFYNNNGKYEGTLQLSEYVKIKSIEVPIKRATLSNVSVKTVISLHLFTPNSSHLTTRKTSSDSFHFTKQLSVDYTNVLYISVNEDIIPLSLNKDCSSCIGYQKTHTTADSSVITDCGIYVVSGSVYTYSSISSTITLPAITLYYI